jgi:hypothetical protein
MTTATKKKTETIIAITGTILLVALMTMALIMEGIK